MFAVGEAVSKLINAVERSRLPSRSGGSREEQAMEVVRFRRRRRSAAGMP